MMDQSVDRGDGDGLVGEDAVPGAEGLVGRDRQTAGFVTPGDEFEEDGGFGLVFLGVANVVEDDEVEAVELGKRRFKGEVAARGLKSLHQVGGAGVKHPPACFDEGVSHGAEQMDLARAGVAD